MQQAKNKFNFIKKTLVNLPLPINGRTYYYDTKIRGLGVAITGKGTKTFIVYKKIDGKPERITLGHFPALSIENARTLALEVNTQIAKGKNPNKEKHRVQQELELGSLFKRYLEHYAKNHKKSWLGDEKLFKRYLLGLERKKISLIKKSDIESLHASIGNNHGKYAANRTLALLQTMYNKAINWGWEGANPCLGIKKFKEKSRDRFLQADEFSKFFQSLAEEVNIIARDFILVSLLTGARKNNVLSMRWKEVNLENRTWRIPETKSGEALTIPLMDEVIQILEQRKFDNKEKGFGNSEFIFPGIGKNGYLADPKKAWKRVLKSSNIEDFRIHDLRRTMGSWQAATGATTVIIGKSLGHKSQQATAIYARLNLDPVRGSMEKATEAMYKNVNNLLKGK